MKYTHPIPNSNHIYFNEYYKKITEEQQKQQQQKRLQDD